MDKAVHIPSLKGSDRLAGLLTSACNAAKKAGRIHLTYYQQKHTIHKKGINDLVTEADPEAEAAIIAALQKDWPEISCLAEESGGTIPSPEETMWIIDPLDGTTSFAHGFPYFGVSIALLEKGVPKIGVVYAPLLDELFYACLGHGAWLNNNRITVTDTPVLIDSLVATGFPYKVKEYLPEILYQLENLLPNVRNMRRGGSAALDLAHVACGRLDAFYERDLQPWDAAAGWLLVLEAGGMVTDYMGNPYSPFQDELVATNSALHPALLPLLT